MRIEEALNDYLKYLKRPVREPKGPDLDVATMMKMYFIVFFFELLLFLPIAQLLGFDKMPHAVDDIFDNFAKWQVALLAIVLAPIIEEMLFRFHLRYKNLIWLFLYIAMFLVAWSMVSLRFGTVHPWELALDLQGAIVPLLVFVVCFILMFGFKETYASSYRIVFYVTAIVFALAHISNFQIEPERIFITPLLVLPQFILGLYLGYVRIKRGIASSIFIHAFNNSIPFMILLTSGFTGSPS